MSQILVKNNDNNKVICKLDSYETNTCVARAR